MGKVSLFLAIFLLTTVAFSWAIPSNYGGGPSFRFSKFPFIIDKTNFIHDFDNFFPNKKEAFMVSI